MNVEIADVTPALVAEFLDRNPLQPFTDGDWHAFNGCESANPRIAYEGNLAMILDGSLIQVIDLDSEYCDFVDLDAEAVAAEADRFARFAGR